MHRVHGVIVIRARALGLFMAAVIAGGIVGGALPTSASGNAGTSRPAQQVRQDTGPDTQDVHGRCVSKGVKDHVAAGGAHHNHGGAVSATAHSCPRE